MVDDLRVRECKEEPEARDSAKQPMMRLLAGLGKGREGSRW